MTDAMTHHSDAEVLAAFVDGNLDPKERDAVTAHIAACEECRGMIREAVAFEREEREEARPRSRTWVPIAAGVMVAVVGLVVMPGYLHQRHVGEGRLKVFAAQKDGRV